MSRSSCGSQRETPRLGRTNGSVRTIEANGAQLPRPDPLGRGNLDLLLGDLSRMLPCDVALVCELDWDRRATVTACWGIDDAFVITVPNGRDRRPHNGRPDRGARGGCFVGRALVHRRGTFEALDPVQEAALIDAAGVPLTHALTVPVEVRSGSGGMMLAAGFSKPPRDLARAFWVAETYARLVALLAHDADALSGLLEHSRRDGLTGCLTYESVLGELVREINRTARANLPLASCFIDLDGFKRVNDLHGHLCGNKVLAEVGRALRDGVRSCDTVGRYGGDEFIAILPQTSATDAARLAERLRSLIATVPAEQVDGRLSASIGVAEWTLGISSEQLLARADSALFAAKGLPGGIAAYGQASPTPAPADPEAAL